MKKKRLSAPIVYAAFYPGGRIVPKYIKYGDLTFKITKILHLWKERIGEKNVLYFSLTDGMNILIVSYTTPNNVWKIEDIHQGIE